jgi:uncharacterized protein YjiS (DUF1127 family)
MATLLRTRPAAFAFNPFAVVARMMQASAMRRQLRHLGELDAYLLDDMGLTRQQAEELSRLPAWDAPSYWRR